MGWWQAVADPFTANGLRLLPRLLPALERVGHKPDRNIFGKTRGFPEAFEFNRF